MLVASISTSPLNLAGILSISQRVITHGLPIFRHRVHNYHERDGVSSGVLAQTLECLARAGDEAPIYNAEQRCAMYPWEHAAVASPLSAGSARWRTGATPGGWAVLVVLVAAQLPDLLDTPLAWQVGFLPSGRALAHRWSSAVPPPTHH